MADEEPRQIKLNLSISGVGARDHIVTVPAEQAAALIEMGHADPVDESGVQVAADVEPDEHDDNGEHDAADDESNTSGDTSSEASPASDTADEAKPVSKPPRSPRAAGK